MIMHITHIIIASNKHNNENNTTNNNDDNHSISIIFHNETLNPSMKSLY